MRKKCVRWAKSVLASLVVAGAACFIGNTASAQSSSPSELPRLEFRDLQYVGGFRLPRTNINGTGFDFGGRQLTFNPAGPSLFAGTRNGKVAEVSIPTPVQSANADALPFATLLQPFADPMEGHVTDVPGEGTGLESVLVYGNRLYGTASVYYDANNSQRVSHFSHSLRLDEPSFSGWSAVWDATKSGFVSGLMAVIPAEWRAALGGPAVTGQCCIPIVTRTSWGPAAFAFDPAKIGTSLVPASPLVYYTGLNPTLGAWTTSNPTYGATTLMGGVAIISGTRTALYFGTNGMGEHCYGTGTGTQSLHKTRAADGELYCYDPTNGDKGSHAYPYRYQIWAYDLNDFAAVKAGSKQPWEVVPYAVWPFDLPTPAQGNMRLGSVGYDPANQAIYVSQLYADKDGYAYRPVIHTLRVNASTRAARVPVSAVSIRADLAVPQNPGTTVRFTATPDGGAAPFEYKWSLYDGTTWTPQADWTTAHEVAWTPASANPAYRMRVSVRSGGSTLDAAEATTEMSFPIGSSRVQSVTLTADKTSPQAIGSTILWTAAASSAGAQYKWWVLANGTWTQVGDWGASNTFAWTPATEGNYRIAVWARGVGSSDAYQATTEAYFTAAGAAMAGPAPAPVSATTPAARASSVAIRSDLASPQPLNTTITWTATPTGGVAPHQYQWWVFDGTAWAAATAFTASSTFTWRPTAVGANYRVAVWVRSAGNGGSHEAANEAYFSIGAQVAAPAPAPAPAATARTTSVSLTSNLAAPQRPNTAITWTATPAGGVAPHQYQWWIFNGTTWMSQPWTTSNTMVWKPTAANPNYRVAVWVRSSGSTAAPYETSAEVYFSISQ